MPNHACGETRSTDTLTTGTSEHVARLSSWSLAGPIRPGVSIHRTVGVGSRGRVPPAVTFTGHRESQSRSVSHGRPLLSPGVCSHTHLHFCRSDTYRPV